MQTTQLLKRNLSYYWRTNLAVVAGVAIAVAVLGGALLVGESVRASLRGLVEQRLGMTDYVVTSSGFFREQLAMEMKSASGFSAFADTVPLIALPGTVSHETNRRVAANVLVYGVDDRFWRFHNVNSSISSTGHEGLVSEGLAHELESKPGDSILLRVQKPTEIPIESLHSKKDDLARTVRLTVKQTLSASNLGEFSLQPQQGATRAVFVPLKMLQKELEQETKANLILVKGAKGSGSEAEPLAKLLKATAILDDYGVSLREIPGRGIALEHDSRLITEALEHASTTAASRSALRVRPIFSYLANKIIANGYETPYSLVTAVDDETFDQLFSQRRTEVWRQRDKPKYPIIVNDWVANQSDLHPDDTVRLDYYYWSDAGKLDSRVANFYLKAVIPISVSAADRDLVPSYPGITGSENLADWDPPFPVDLSLVRKQDEDYWDQYGTTPKAFIPISAGRELWSSRFGQATSLRLRPTNDRPIAETLQDYKLQLRDALDPSQMGFMVIPVREQGLSASSGATDFGEYFLYFSFFLVVSALLVTALFFKLGVEQRLREIGLLQAVGFRASQVRTLFLLEGIALCLVGSVIGLLGALAYGRLMMYGLSTWWVDAVGTTNLKLHVSPLTLLIGATGGILAAVFCIVWTLRRLRRASTRSLLMGSFEDTERRATERKRRLLTTLNLAIIFAVLGIGLLLAAAFKVIGQVGGFFGGGTLLLIAALCFQSSWLSRNRRRAISGNGWSPILQLGFRNTAYRPGRSVLCIALIASAAFIIVSVDAFRRSSAATTGDHKSGTGGFPLLAESLVPLANDPNSAEGREALNLNDGQLSSANFSRFRLKPGDDASCLNLYQPRDPRIIAPREDFIQSNRFGFAGSLAETDAEKSNPWLLLKRTFPDGAVPVFGDANSMTYVLHRKLGEDFILQRQSGPIRLRLVGALSDSIFQSELIMSEENFLKLFPEHEGYRFFLIDTPAPNELSSLLEDRLSDFGFDVESTAERLANFHRVENTYLSTFQMLGGLGLLLGTFGLAAVLMRNVLERRRELALLRAVGYNSSHFAGMIIAENALLLFCGLATGTACAVLAIAPVFFERGGRLPNVSLGLLLLAVLISGLIASVVATWTALRSPLLPALRAE
jgi:putative ABC transport system permease protein